MDYIKKCDYLYREAKFTFNKEGETGKKTIFGGIISIISIIISLGFTGYFSYRLLYRKDSSLILSTLTDQYINITYSHKLPFMVRFSDSYSIPYINETSRLYNIYLRLWFGGTNNTEEENRQYFDTIKVSKCDINKHFGEYKELFKEISDLNTYYCPDLRDYNQTIYGIYGGTKPFSYIHFYFVQCLNESMNNTCFDEDYINKILSATYLDIKLIDYKMDSLKNKVGNIEIKSERFLISNSVYKRIWVYIRKINYITDTGLAFSSNKEETFHLYENIRSDTDIRNIKTGSIPGAFLTLSILNNGEISIYRRKYLKIQDYIATVGGIIKAITILGELINYFNGRNSLYFSIIKDFMIINKIGSYNDKTNSANFQNDIFKSSHISNNKSGSSFLKRFNSYSLFDQKNKTKIVPEMDINKKVTLYQNSKIIKEEELNEISLYNNFLFSILPPIFFGKTKYEKSKNSWYFENINERLNIINILKLLKKIDSLKPVNKYNSINKKIGNFFDLSKIKNQQILKKEQSFIVFNSEV